VANSERTFPAKWIAKSGYDVTDEFLAYARPLVGDQMLTMPMVDGRYRMTCFNPIYAKQTLPKYVPQADRK
jgi:6-phosphofructokinase 1